MPAPAQPPRLRIVSFNDVYELANLARVQTFLSKLNPAPTAVVLCGDYVSPGILSALDGGKGMVSTLRAVGVTHASLGNHEADLRLPVLEKRLASLSKTATVLNANVGRAEPTPVQAQFLRNYPTFSVVETPCHRVRVALMGLLSDEPGIFRDGTFRGAAIANVLDTYQSLWSKLVHRDRAVDLLIPMTHQTLRRDQDLAKLMLSCHDPQQPWQPSSFASADQAYMGLILGGHDHTPYDVTVRDDQDNTNSAVRILKAGCEAATMSLIDLTFDLVEPSQGEHENPSPAYHPTARLVHVDYELVEMSQYEASAVVQQVIDSHMSLVKALENEIVVRAGPILPPGAALSSEKSRFQQTTVGSVFCMAIKEELEADVAIINGASIKGDTKYTNTEMTYAQLKVELPFPVKMVVVPMKRHELQDAIHHSRTAPNHPDEEAGAPSVARKGYLQVDVQYDHLGFHTGDQDDELKVALPRNLLKGFCNIVPLMKVGKRLEEEGTFPGEDDFVPAINLVVRHFSKERWFEIVQDDLTFTDLDDGGKGYLTREDVKKILRQALGHEPAAFVVDDMLAAVDYDENGIIDQGEFSYLLAEMERQHGSTKFE